MANNKPQGTEKEPKNHEDLAEVREKVDEILSKSSISSFIREGRITIKKGKEGWQGYPNWVNKELAEISDETVKHAILEADLSAEGVIGHDGAIRLELYSNNYIKVGIFAKLAHSDGEQPSMKVDVFASHPYPNSFPRWESEDGGDGQCTMCSGGGCWDCNDSGGY